MAALLFGTGKDGVYLERVKNQTAVLSDMFICGMLANYVFLDHRKLAKNKTFAGQEES